MPGVRLLPDDALMIVAKGEKKDEGGAGTLKTAR
jgi:hypothetical protein